MIRNVICSDFAEMVSRVERNPSVIGVLVYVSQDASGMSSEIFRNPTPEKFWLKV